jgi:4-hydroxy-3-polyprenylbenzoate decarboxylase
LFHDQGVLPLVAFLDAEERKKARGTKVIYSCLPADDVPAKQVPRRSSFRYAWPAEVQERVVRGWRGYGYT